MARDGVHPRRMEWAKITDCADVNTESVGRKFKSCRAHQLKKGLQTEVRNPF